MCIYKIHCNLLTNFESENLFLLVNKILDFENYLFTLVPKELK